MFKNYTLIANNFSDGNKPSYNELLLYYACQSEQ